MKLIHQIIISFASFLVLIAVGLGLNMNRLGALMISHKQIAEEWGELNNIFSLENQLDGLIQDFSTESSPFQTTVADRIRGVSGILDKLRQSAKVESFEASSHGREEYSRFIEIDNSFIVFLDNMRDYKITSTDPEQSRNIRLHLIEGIEGVKDACTRLRQFYTEGMGAAVVHAELSRKEMLGQMIGISVTLFVLLGMTSMWFVFLLRRKAEAVLLDEKMTTIDILASGIAHEIRNPLGIIKSSASIIKSKMPDGSEEKEISEYMIAEADRIDILLSQISNLGHKRELHYHSKNISVLVDQVLVLFKGETEKSKIHIQYDNKCGDDECLCDPDQIKQLLLNLLLNAVQASRPDSQIIVRTEVLGDYYNIIVEDSGKGMDKLQIKRIYEPFYTSKAKGTGLGLTIVKKIVDDYKGHIEVLSNINKGTTITIKLPKNGRPEKKK